MPESVLLDELYPQYENAGNVSTHLFQLNDSRISRDLNVEDLKDILEENDLIDAFQQRIPIQLIYVPQPVYFNYVDRNGGRIYTRYEYLGRPEILRDPSTRRLVRLNPLKTAFSCLHVSDGLFEVRTRSRDVAYAVARALRKVFGGQYRDLSFSRDQLGQWIDWALTLRNARFKPIAGVLSTLWMTARRELDLRDEEMFKEWWSRGEPLTGVYIRFEYSKGRLLGFSINARRGSIYFKSYASEDEIEFVLKKAKEILGI